MKKIFVIFLWVAICSHSIGQVNKDFTDKSRFTSVNPEIRMGNTRYLKYTVTDFKKVEANVSGLGDNAIIGKWGSCLVAMDEPRTLKSGRIYFSKVLVNLKGKRCFKVSSPDVISIKGRSGMGIEQHTINGKNYSIGYYLHRNGASTGGKMFCSVAPVYEGSLNIGNVNVKIIGTSHDCDLEFDPRYDKMVIHKPQKEGDYYRNIRVFDVELDKPFFFGEGDAKKWYVLKWNPKNKSIRVEESKILMGAITANDDWSVTLKPGDSYLEGKAGELVGIPVGDYKIYILTGYYGDASLSEFDYLNGKSPEFSIKKDATYVLNTLDEFNCWFDHGWYKNTLGVIVRFRNANGAGNMNIFSKGKQVKWNYELIEKDSGKVIHSGGMHFG